MKMIEAFGVCAVLAACSGCGDRRVPGTYNPSTVTDDACQCVGQQGVQGEPGLNGKDSTVSGPQGIPGKDGRDGLDGAQGIQGIPGPQGVMGVTGATGATGAVGSPGIAGLAGKNGIDGTSCSVSMINGNTVEINCGDTEVRLTGWISVTCATGDYVVCHQGSTLCLTTKDAYIQRLNDGDTKGKCDDGGCDH